MQPHQPPSKSTCYWERSCEQICSLCPTSRRANSHRHARASAIQAEVKRSATQRSCMSEHHDSLARGLALQGPNAGFSRAQLDVGPAHPRRQRILRKASHSNRLIFDFKKSQITPSRKEGQSLGYSSVGPIPARELIDG